MTTGLTRRQLLLLSSGVPLWLAGCKSSEPARVAAPEERGVKLVIPADLPVRGGPQLALGVLDLVEQGAPGPVLGRVEIIAVHAFSVTAFRTRYNLV